MDIYYTEDDQAIAAGVKTYLEARNCQVTVINTIAETKLMLLSRRPALMLIDWNLPDGSGDELCAWIRRRFGNDLPVLFLTVKGETADIVNGFQNGADDYLVKPFELAVLYSRMTAILRRTENVASPRLTCDGIELDREKMTVTLNGAEVSLSHSEYLLLRYLLENKGKTVSREMLLEKIWDDQRNYVNDNTLTVTVKRLRSKLGNPAGLKTIRSFGYRMEDTR